MPMPVSATANTTARPSSLGRALTRTSPRSVNLSAFEMKLRKICETFASSVCSAGSALTSSKARISDSLTSSGRSMPRSAPKRFSTVNSTGRMTILPASIFAVSSRSLTSSNRSSAARRMKPICVACSVLRGPSA